MVGWYCNVFMFYNWIYMDQKEFQFLIFLISLASFGTIIAFIVLISFLQKKKVQFILEKERAKANYEEQLMIAEVEITDQNLKNISWELHDNIGQLLSVASMEAKMLMQKETLTGSQLEDVVNVLGQSIAQVRGLSKTLNSDMIQKLGLRDALIDEFERLERIGLLKTPLEFCKDIIIGSKKEIVIFRMLQEFISNVLKHAQASELIVKVLRDKDMVVIQVKDNGIGFDKETVKGNNGLLNLESRSKLIEAEFMLDSNIGEGTVMELIFDNKTSSYEKV
jgi:signal transduction histidine kinase